MTVIKAPEHEVFLSSAGTYRVIQEMTEWCELRFGPIWSVTGNRHGRWCCFWGFGGYRWCFTDEKDLTLFLLRWA